MQLLACRIVNKPSRAQYYSNQLSSTPRWSLSCVPESWDSSLQRDLSMCQRFSELSELELQRVMRELVDRHSIAIFGRAGIALERICEISQRDVAPTLQYMIKLASKAGKPRLTTKEEPPQAFDRRKHNQYMVESYWGCHDFVTRRCTIIAKHDKACVESRKATVDNERGGKEPPQAFDSHEKINTWQRRIEDVMKVAWRGRFQQCSACASFCRQQHSFTSSSEA